MSQWCSFGDGGRYWRWTSRVTIGIQRKVIVKHGIVHLVTAITPSRLCRVGKMNNWTMIIASPFTLRIDPDGRYAMCEKGGRKWAHTGDHEHEEVSRIFAYQFVLVTCLTRHSVLLWSELNQGMSHQTFQSTEPVKLHTCVSIQGDDGTPRHSLHMHDGVCQ